MLQSVPAQAAAPPPTAPGSPRGPAAGSSDLPPIARVGLLRDGEPLGRGKSARALEQLGFRALATTSAGFAWTLGRADNRVSLDEALGHLRRVASSVAVPVNTDVEGAFAVDPQSRRGERGRPRSPRASRACRSRTRRETRRGHCMTATWLWGASPRPGGYPRQRDGGRPHGSLGGIRLRAPRHRGDDPPATCTTPRPGRTASTPRGSRTSDRSGRSSTQCHPSR